MNKNFILWATLTAIGFLGISLILVFVSYILTKEAFIVWFAIPVIVAIIFCFGFFTDCITDVTKIEAENKINR